MRGKELDFNPFFLFKDPHLQTCLGSVNYGYKDPISQTHLINLDDGDKIALEESTPDLWRDSSPIVLFVHGLCGSHKSVYLIRLVQRLFPKGVKTVRFNMRGCGSGRGHARKIYHSGKSEDVFEAVKYLKLKHPNSPITVIGFSLGGNVVLKMMGELGRLGSRFVSNVIAVCPPVDLQSSADMSSKVVSGLYGKYFYKLLRESLIERSKFFADIPKIELPEDLTLLEFDKLFTVPSLGFESVQEYYDKCSAKNVIQDIDIPTKVLLSQDDPIVSHRSLDGHNLASHIEVYKTKMGGHMGYLGNPFGERGFFWLDSLIEDWVLSK